MPEAQNKVENVQFTLLFHHLHHGLYRHERPSTTHSCTAMINERPGSGTFEIVDPIAKRYDGMGIVGNPKVRPTSVVELLHLTTVVSLEMSGKVRMVS